jgi:hypothetical protein
MDMRHEQGRVNKGGCSKRLYLNGVSEALKCSGSVENTIENQVT